MNLKIYHTGPLEVNTYVLCDNDSKEAVVFDVGGDFEKIKSETEKNGYVIKFVLNTHGHYDHVAGEAYIRKNYPQIPVYMSKDDLPHILKLRDILTAIGYPCPEENLEISDFIDEKSELYIGKNKIGILKTPGHSKGGLSYYIKPYLFSGDTLFYRSIGRTDFFDGDYDTLINSIKSELFPLPDDTQVFPGHGDSTTIKDEKLKNFCLT